MKIKYNSKGGPLDTFLFKLIRKRFRNQIIQDKVTRGNVEIIRGVSAGTLGTSFMNNDDGVFYKKDGQIHRTFLYLPRYYIETYNRYPARHLFVCEKVNSYGGFHLSNQDNVNILCRDTKKIHKNINLITCTFCKELFYEKVGKQLYKQDFNEVILDFEESPKTKNVTTGIDGYVTNWSEISTAVRELKNYKCEKCYFKMKDKTGFHFMHVHHIDYNKTNNRRSNLQCLCIQCHANIDDIHRKNFGTIYHQRLIQEFMDKYKL